MMRMNGRLTIALSMLVCLAAAAALAGEPAATMTTGQAPCCFENPRFSGTCEVVPGEGESCGSILSYLNNPNSVGKDYCGNTTIRGGWNQVECESSTAVADSCTVDDGTESVN
jgi:hypothetical protein